MGPVDTRTTNYKILADPSWQKMASKHQRVKFFKKTEKWVILETRLLIVKIDKCKNKTFL